jgi:hypothetical protein
VTIFSCTDRPRELFRAASEPAIHEIFHDVGTWPPFTIDLSVRPFTTTSRVSSTRYLHLEISTFCSPRRCIWFLLTPCPRISHSPDRDRTPTSDAGLTASPKVVVLSQAPTLTEHAASGLAPTPSAQQRASLAPTPSAASPQVVVLSQAPTLTEHAASGLAPTPSAPQHASLAPTPSHAAAVSFEAPTPCVLSSSASLAPTPSLAEQVGIPGSLTHWPPRLVSCRLLPTHTHSPLPGILTHWPPRLVSCRLLPTHTHSPLPPRHPQPSIPIPRRLTWSGWQSPAAAMLRPKPSRPRCSRRHDRHRLLRWARARHRTSLSPSPGCRHQLRRPPRLASNAEQVSAVAPTPCVLLPSASSAPTPSNAEQAVPTLGPFALCFAALPTHFGPLAFRMPTRYPRWPPRLAASQQPTRQPTQHSGTDTHRQPTAHSAAHSAQRHALALAITTAHSTAHSAQRHALALAITPRALPTSTSPPVSPLATPARTRTTTPRASPMPKSTSTGPRPQPTVPPRTSRLLQPLRW